MFVRIIIPFEKIVKYVRKQLLVDALTYVKTSPEGGSVVFGPCRTDVGG